MKQAEDDFRKIADILARQIAEGTIRPGTRLPPQREFAFQRGIAASTAGRVYGELRRRSLVSGEVGRGTFVRSAPLIPNATLIDLTGGTINLELVFPSLDAHAKMIGQVIADLALSRDWPDALRSVGAIPPVAARERVAAFLSRSDWTLAPENIFLTGSGKQAIAAALTAIAPPGSRIGVEALTYPVIRGLVAPLGIELVPLECDEQGLSVDALSVALERERLAALYLQPSLHNPTGATMPPARREALARVLVHYDMPVVEDAIYQFLVDDRPLAAYAPEHVIMIDSFSKRVAPGLALGVIATLTRYAQPIAQAIRQSAYMPSGIAVALGSRLLEAGLMTRFAIEKQRDAVARQEIARQAFSSLAVRGDSRAYHLWLDLPSFWRAERFASVLLKQGIAVTSGNLFSVLPGHAPNGIRIALAAPPLGELRRALEIVAAMAAIPEQSELE